MPPWMESSFVTFYYEYITRKWDPLKRDQLDWQYSLVRTMCV